MQQHNYEPTTSGVLALRASIYIWKSDWNADWQETNIHTNKHTCIVMKNSTVFFLLLTCCLKRDIGLSVKGFSFRQIISLDWFVWYVRHVKKIKDRSENWVFDVLFSHD